MEPRPAEPANDALPPVGIDDDGRDRAGDDRQVAAAPRRATSAGSPSRSASAARRSTAASRSTRSACEPARAGRRLPRCPPPDLRGAGRLSPFRTTRSGCWPSRRCSSLSLAVGLCLSREMFRQLGMAGEGLRLIRDEEFTSRFLRGRAAGDRRADRRLQQDGRPSARRARAARRTASVPEPGARRCRHPAWSILDFDQRVAQPQPGGRTAARTPAADVVGRPLDALESPLAEALATLAPGDARFVGLLGAPAGASAITARSSIAGSPAASC